MTVTRAFLLTGLAVLLTWGLLIMAAEGLGLGKAPAALWWCLALAAIPWWGNFFRFVYRGGSS